MATATSLPLVSVGVFAPSPSPSRALAAAARLSPFSPSFPPPSHLSRRATRVNAPAASAPPRRIRVICQAADVATPAAPASVELPLFDFPGVPSAVRQMMDELVLKVQETVGDELLPTSTPRNVRRFSAPAPAGQNEGFVWVFRGRDGSKVRRVLVSWLLCRLPGGFAFGKATLEALMSPVADTPHLVLEFTFSGSDGPSESEVPPLEFSTVFAAMDLLPRKDPVMHPEYMDAIYGVTGIDKLRAELTNTKGVCLYVPPTMHMRALMSPAALTFTARMPPESSTNADLVNLFQPAAARLADVWAESAMGKGKPVPEEDVPAMRARDEMYGRDGTNASFEMNLPVLFGEEITRRVVEALED